MTRPAACPDSARLRDLLDGALPPDEQAAVAGHLETCDGCQQTADALSAAEPWPALTDHLEDVAAAPDPGLRRVIEQARSGPPASLSEPAALDFLSPPETPGHLGKLGPYEVLEEIGRGGMGVVLRAFDPALRSVVAVKVMAPLLATTATARQRFLREARAAAAVRNEYVIGIQGVGEANGLPYLVMEYIAGRSLQDRLDKGGPLDVAEVLRIGRQAAEGLAAAHAQGLVHRDVKPANILLENGVERVKLTDFGLARAADDASLTQSGVVAGTRHYMAPEQADSGPVDHRADLFSLGGVLYAMCTGQPPFRGGGPIAVLKRVCEQTPRPIREVNPAVPDWLAGVITRL